MANQVDVEKALTFVVNAIKARDPDFDLTENTPFYDLFVRFFTLTTLPEIILLADSIVSNNTLSNTALSTAKYDALASNYFVDRITGTNTFVSATLVFAKKTPQIINTADIFTINGVNFHPTYRFVVTENDFTTINIGEYAIDLSLISVDSGAGTVVPDGSKVIPPTSIIDFTRGYVSILGATGDDSETNDVLLARIQREFGIRNLINLRSINNTLSDLFPSLISQVYIAGYGEKEMVRDIFPIAIPKRIARLIFTDKIDLTLPKTHMFFYNDNDQIRYTLLSDLSITANSTAWVQHSSGNWFVEVEIELYDLFNPDSFKEDAPMANEYLTLNYPQYVISVSRTTSYGDAVIRIGGLTDIYVRVPIEKQTISLTVPVDSGGLVSLPANVQPVLKIISVTTVDGSNTTVPVNIFSIIPANKKVRFSALDDSKLFVDPGLVGQDITVELICSPSVQYVHNALNEPLRRVISEDVLLKAFNPVFVDLYIALIGNETNVDDMKNAVTSEINSLPYNTVLEKNHIIKTVQEQTLLMGNVILDTLQMTVQQSFPDGNVTELPNNDVYTVIPNEDLGVTANNCLFITNDIQVVFI